jgi:hypothetical protein
MGCDEFKVVFKTDSGGSLMLSGYRYKLTKRNTNSREFKYPNINYIQTFKESDYKQHSSPSNKVDKNGIYQPTIFRHKYAV